MSWEALRLTSRSPAELYTVLGPHGVDDLIRQAISDCWREYPQEQRTLEAVRKVVRDAFERNIGVWSAIKKPSPAAFFENLLPHAVDGHLRQALVLCWMMLPRGKRDIADVQQVVSDIFQRNMAAWEQDHVTFTKGPPGRVKKAKKPIPKAPVVRKKTPVRKVTKTSKGRKR